jgi:putative ABC transport system substrate-binding protein
MNRRAVLLGAGGLAAWPFSTPAQSPLKPVLGWLSQYAATFMNFPDFSGVQQGLRESGGFRIGPAQIFSPGYLPIEYRWAEWHTDRLPALAADLVAKRVNAIFALGGPAPALAAKAATSTIPIVFLNGSDPVKAGLVASLSRPGGNITGVTHFSAQLGAKKLQFLIELVPGSSLIAVLTIPNDADSQAELEQVQLAAQPLGQRIEIVGASAEQDLEDAFRQAAQLHCPLLVTTGGLFGNNALRIAALAERYATPAMFDRREIVDVGGLISYGTYFREAGYRAGLLVGRVLKGEKPGDLPVEQPTGFELVINLNAAKKLGITVPQPLLARADEVIE